MSRVGGCRQKEIAWALETNDADVSRAMSEINERLKTKLTPLWEAIKAREAKPVLAPTQALAPNQNPSRAPVPTYQQNQQQNNDGPDMGR